MRRQDLTRGHRLLTGVVVVGVLVIASIGFVGSYSAVRALAGREGFGWFSYVFPVGVDVGITVFLALDLLLTWMRIPLPALRYLAWLLTGATIVFNAASAWPRPLASAMHGVVPLLFVAAIEATRHAVGRLADIEANRYMEKTRFGRWLVAPIATVRLWRRRQLWELRSNQEAIEMERRRLVYRARLRSVYGRGWRRSAPVELLLLLKLANLGEPLPALQLDLTSLQALLTLTGPGTPAVQPHTAVPAQATPIALVKVAEHSAEAPSAAPESERDAQERQGEADEEPVPTAGTAPDVQPENGTEREKALDAVPPPDVEGEDEAKGKRLPPDPEPERRRQRIPAQPSAVGAVEERYYQAFQSYTERHGANPDADQLAAWLWSEYAVGSVRTGEPLTASGMRRYMRAFRERFQAEVAQAELQGSDADAAVGG